MRLSDGFGRSSRRAATPDESGSLLVVIGILVVVGLLATAMINRIGGDQTNTNYETNLQLARSAAQSGVADALFQIDQRDASPGNFCDAPPPHTGTSPCANGVPNSPYTQYTATYDASADAYTILSRGTVRGVSYAVKAVAAADPILNSALTGSTLTFDGSSFRSIYVTGPDGLAISGAKANISVATGGTLTCHGNTGSNVQYIEYAGSSTNCTPLVTNTNTFQPQQISKICPAKANPEIEPPTPCLLPTAKSCSTMASSWSGNDNTGYTVSGTLEPGIYVCYGGLTISGTTTVDYAQSPQQNNGRVEIYVFGPVNNPLTSTNFTLGGTINACEVGTPTSNPSTNCVSGSTQLVGDPSDLQLYVYGGGNLEVGSLNSINAVLWAPGLVLDTHGAAVSLTWTGAMVIGTVDAHGTPATFLLNYDVRLATEMQDIAWGISSYLQTSPSFSIPNF